MSSGVETSLAVNSVLAFSDRFLDPPQADRNDKEAEIRNNLKGSHLHVHTRLHQTRSSPHSPRGEVAPVSQRRSERQRPLRFENADREAEEGIKGSRRKG